MGVIDDIHNSYISKMGDTGNLKGLSQLLKGAGSVPAADGGTAKIPLTLLPAGVQPGQRISLTVTGIDAVSGMATIVPDAVQNAVAPMPTTNAATMSIDQLRDKITASPLDSYFFQKKQEQEGNQ